MSTTIPSNWSLVHALQKQGLLPDECRSVEILTGSPDGVMGIRYEVNVSREDLAKLAAAFVDAAQEDLMNR